MKKLIIFTLLLVASLAFGADAPPERAEALAVAKDFFIQAWPVLVGWAISEIMPFLPSKANGIAHLIKVWVDSKRGV